MVTENKTTPELAILALTRGGSELGLQLARSMGDCKVYLPQRLAADINANAKVSYFQDWDLTFKRVFTQYRRIICIMATGIVVRSLAGCLRSKHLDPGVVVVDEKGQFAISLLSGHIGGANQLAREVARQTGGQAVITTATDVQGKTAADLLALEMDALIDPTGNLKIINRCLAENQPVNLYSPWPLIPAVMNGFAWQGWPFEKADPENQFPVQLDYQSWVPPAVIVGHIVNQGSHPDILWLKPRNLSVGIGCRLGVGCEELGQAINEVFDRFNIDTRCISSIASIELKAKEPGINLLAEQMEVPFLTFGQEDILPLAGTYDESAWVKEITGVGGVCEPAARLASRRGITLVPKQKIGPIAISVAMEKSWWWDWGPATASI